MDDLAQSFASLGQSSAEPPNLWDFITTTAHPKSRADLVSCDDALRALITARNELMAPGEDNVEHQRNLSFFCQCISRLGAEHVFRQMSNHHRALVMELMQFLCVSLESVDQTRLQQLDLLRALNALLHDQGWPQGFDSLKVTLIGHLTAIVTPGRTYMTPFQGASDLKMELDRKRMALNCLQRLLQKCSLEKLQQAFIRLSDLLDTLLHRGSEWIYAEQTTHDGLALLIQELALRDTHLAASPETAPWAQVKPSFLKLLATGLRSLQLLLVEKNTLLDQSNIGQLLKLVHLCLSRAPPASSNEFQFGYGAYSASRRLRPATSKPKYIPPHLRADAGALSAWSETEMSDVDGPSRSGSRTAKDESKLKQQALSLLHHIALTQSKLFFPYLNMFVDERGLSLIRSDESTKLNILLRHLRPLSILHYMLDETDSRLCAQAWSTFGAMLKGSKPFLAVATEQSQQKRTGSFVSQSEKIFDLVLGLHKLMVRVMEEELDQIVLSEVLPVAVDLLKNSTYDRIETALPSEVISAALNCVLRMTTGRSAALEQIPLMMNVLLEQERVLGKFRSHLEAAFAPHTETLIKLTKDEKMTCMLRAHAMECLRVYVLLFASLPSNVRDQMNDVIHTIFNTNEAEVDSSTASEAFKESIVLHSAALKLLVAMMQREAVNEKISLEWWNVAIELFLQKAASIVSEQATSLRALACDSFTQIPDSVLDNLPQRCRSLCLTLSLGLLNDSGPLVRTAAARTLGVYVIMPSQCKDSLFVKDVLDAMLSLLKDSQPLLVRTRASWSLANALDALTMHCLPLGMEDTEHEAILPENITSGFILSTLKQLTPMGKDNEKLRSNILRAIGDMIRLLPSTLLRREQNAVLKDALLVLEWNTHHGLAKTNWNACHAIAVAFKHPKVPMAGAQVTPRLVRSLLKVLQTHKNFKVRSHVCQALQHIRDRAWLSVDETPQNESLWVDVWAVLLVVHGQMKQGPGDASAFDEWKQFEQFQRQVEETATYWRTLMSGRDQEVLKERGLPLGLATHNQ